MAKTVADRQAKFRARMKERGCKQKLIWVNSVGLEVLPNYDEVLRPKADYNKLIKELKSMVEPLDAYAEQIYGDILRKAKEIVAAYARMDEIGKSWQ